MSRMLRTQREGLIPKTLAALALAAVIFATSVNSAQSATTFVVTQTGNNNDLDLTDNACDVVAIIAGSQCTLRAAIQQANATAGADTINFNIPGTGVKTIAPSGGPLPRITDPVTINGYSQPGSKPNTNGPGLGSNAVLLIELNGTNAGTDNLGIAAPGLDIRTRDSTVKGLVINRFWGAGIRLEGQGGYTIAGNFIGTDPAGDTALPNGLGGIRIDSASDGAGSTIGGTTPAARNVISGNGLFGVEIITDDTNVQGNLIGTSASGTADLGNSGPGVHVLFGPGNVVGGATAAARNVISGNAGDGVIFEATGPNSQVQGNFVRGNYIGTNVKGTGALGNSKNGVLLYGTCGTVKNNVVGGTAPGEGNVIAFNSFTGVSVASDPCFGTFGPWAFGNSILSNSIFSHVGPGIDLGRDGETGNDAGDSDTGSNNLQNSPYLTSVSTSGSTTTIEGTLNSVPSTDFIVQFFSIPLWYPDRGEGKTYLGQSDVTTDAGGDASFTTTVPAVPAELGVSATATNDTTGDTSEFSPADQCTIRGTSDLDIITASQSPGPDVICGNGGNDQIDAGEGDDVVVGGNHDDIIIGGKGRDRVFGGPDDDTLIVRDGVRRNDLVDGGDGTDACKRDRKDRRVSCP